MIKKDHRYKPPRVFRAVETERPGQVPHMRVLRDRLDAELSEPLAVFRDREARQRVQVREALGRLLLGDGTPEDGIPKEIVDKLESIMTSEMVNITSELPRGLTPAQRTALVEHLKLRLAGRLLW